MGAWLGRVPWKSCSFTWPVPASWRPALNGARPVIYDLQIGKISSRCTGAGSNGFLRASAWRLPLTGMARPTSNTRCRQASSLTQAEMAW
jgi:hypothetical protein